MTCLFQFIITIPYPLCKISGTQQVHPRKAIVSVIQIKLFVQPVDIQYTKRRDYML